MAMANYRILSFDGGGIRGVLTAGILKELNEFQEISGFLSKVDLFAGTSTGGLIALGLANGIKPEEILDFYITHGPPIFSRPWWREIPGLSFLMDALVAKYKNETLKETLTNIFGGHLRLKDLRKKVLIVTFLMDNEKKTEFRTWKPKFFHNYEITGDNDGEEKVVDVAMRTAAAPTYFPSYGKYIDGGVVANNPALSALLQAIYIPKEDFRDHRKKKPKELGDIALLSFGTGKAEQFREGRNLNWGWARWAKTFPELNLSTLVRMVSWECERLIGPQYHRINPLLPEVIEMDKAEKIPFLVELIQKEHVQLDIIKAKHFIEEYF
jgi:patatin-like phospholipase/acyl hydrolase